MRRCALQFSESWGAEEYPGRHIWALYLRCAFTGQTCAFPACGFGCCILHSIIRKKMLLTLRSRAAVKGCPAHTSNSALCAQMRLCHPQTRSLKVISWSDWLEKARFTQRPSEESDYLLKLSWESQTQKSAVSCKELSGWKYNENVYGSNWARNTPQTIGFGEYLWMCKGKKYLPYFCQSHVWLNGKILFL